VLPLTEAGADGGAQAEMSAGPLSAEGASPVAAPEPQRFESPHPVLLVDDNEVNLLVATEILESFGLTVEVASGGREAIEAALGRDYALVLMDCQMPEVDGYEATAEIRRSEQGKRLPIIAFTAHALAEERTKVLAAGMSDDEALVDLEPGRRRPLRALTLFVERTPRQIDELRAAAAAERHDQLRDIAHLMKGSAGSLGAKRLAALCERMQVSAPDLPPERARALVEQIALAYDAARAPIATEIERQRSAS
jgi:CheY-like chemotaxis protein